MGRRFDLVVFDWDGTLLDSAGAIVACLRAACEDLGIEPPHERLARHVIGLGLRDALGTAVPALPPSEYGRLAERYRHHFLNQDHDLRLFDGMFEVLERLHGAGVLLGIATGKSRHGLDRALALSGLGRFFSLTCCADESTPKPHPAMLLEIMQSLTVPPARALMVGDTTHDLLMARNAGVEALAVGFGAHSRAELLALEPLACFDTVGELDEWMARHI
jgi:phosphoglycolate phosphatase